LLCGTNAVSIKEKEKITALKTKRRKRLFSDELVRDLTEEIDYFLYQQPPLL